MEDIKMAKLTAAEMIEAIKELSVLELNELVKACEEEFGVSALSFIISLIIQDIKWPATVSGLFGWGCGQVAQSLPH